MWASYHANRQHRKTLEDHAAERGIEVIGLDATTPEIEYGPDNPFTYWHECHDAIECYLRYLTDQWLYTFGGIAGLDVKAAMPVIACYTQDPKVQLQMLEDIKYFAQGVKTYYDEQNDTKTEKSS